MTPITQAGRGSAQSWQLSNIIVGQRRISLNSIRRQAAFDRELLAAVTPDKWSLSHGYVYSTEAKETVAACYVRQGIFGYAADPTRELANARLIAHYQQHASAKADVTEALVARIEELEVLLKYPHLKNWSA